MANRNGVSDAQHGSTESWQKKVGDLEARIAQLTRERDDLARDVENLCMQTGDSSMFNASSVLSERIYFAEKELTKCQRQLEAMTAECNSLREDNKALKESKRTSDTSWKEQKNVNKSLEKELAFYQQQSARAMADRDKAVWEAEDLRHQNLNIENELRKLEGRVLAEQSARQQADQALKECKLQVTELQQQVAKSSTLPLLEKELEKLKQDLAVAHQEKHQLQEDMSILREQLKDEQIKTGKAKEETESAKTELIKCIAEQKERSEQLQADKKTAEDQLHKLQEEFDSLELRADEAEGCLAAAQAEVEVLRRKTDEQLDGQRLNFDSHLSQIEHRHKQEREELRQQLESELATCAKLQAELDEITSQKVSALMRLSAEQEKATKSAEDAESLRDQLNELKLQLSKVEATGVAAPQTASPKPNSRARQPATRTFWGQPR